MRSKVCKLSRGASAYKVSLYTYFPLIFGGGGGCDVSLRDMKVFRYKS